MNVEETAKLIEVMQAYVDGKAIERRVRASPGQWKTVIEPVWDYSCADYRIAQPKAPRDLWVNLDKDPGLVGFAYRDKNRAEEADDSWVCPKAVHYRRVDDE